MIGTERSSTRRSAAKRPSSGWWPPTTLDDAHQSVGLSPHQQARLATTALEDPDSLDAFVTDDDVDNDCDNEDLNYAAERAYETNGTNREELVRDSNEFEAPQGDPQNLDSLAAVLPRLTKRFPGWLR